MNAVCFSDPGGPSRTLDHHEAEARRVAIRKFQQRFAQRRIEAERERLEKAMESGWRAGYADGQEEGARIMEDRMRGEFVGHLGHVWRDGRRFGVLIALEAGRQGYSPQDLGRLLSWWEETDDGALS